MGCSWLSWPLHNQQAAFHNSAAVDLTILPLSSQYSLSLGEDVIDVVFMYLDLMARYSQHFEYLGVSVLTSNKKVL